MVLRMKKMNGIFVTGTDTGVGKTIVSATLLCALRSKGIDAVYMKPVQTGCRLHGKRLIAPDLEMVSSLAGINPSEKERQLMAPCRFRMACSPHLAAELERRKISVPEILRAYAWLKKRHEVVIVEGAGGILTPILRQYSMLNLMQALKLPVVVVARPGLGTINHTLLTLRELRRAKLNILGVVINHAVNERKTVIEKDNLKTIERLGRTRIIAELPFIQEL
jgi:dethiobiotin synthetase